jgi:hypothetical protein
MHGCLLFSFQEVTPGSVRQMAGWITLKEGANAWVRTEPIVGLRESTT